MGKQEATHHNKEVIYTLRTEYRRGENVYLLYHMDTLIIQTTHKPVIDRIINTGSLRAWEGAENTDESILEQSSYSAERV